MSLREITTERIDNFISMLRKKGIVIIKAVALPTLELYKKQNRLGPAANDNLRSNVRGCSASAIARAAGLAQSTVSKALAGESVSKDTADKISAAMGYDTNVLFEVTESREPYAEKTLAEYFGYIQAVLSAAEKRGIISRNPARAAMHPSTAITTPRR